MNRSTKRFSLNGAGERGAYGIRTRATAVRGRRPRPLDECAVPRQGSRSGLSIAWPRRAVWSSGGPASCGPNAEPPFVPESSAVLPGRGASRECSGTMDLIRLRCGKRTKSRTSPPKVRGGSRGRCRGATAPDEAAACRLRDLVSLAGPRWKPRRSQNRLPARIRRAPDGGADLDEDRADGETWPRPAGSATFLRPSRAAIVLRRGSPIS